MISLWKHIASEEITMAEIERMTVVFPEPMAALLRAAVEAGEYASTSEAVRDAVRLWESRRRLREDEIERLRHAWDRGKASGPSVPFDRQSILAGARQKKRTLDNG
jgi:antitoxin ParD1/3/4